MQLCAQTTNNRITCFTPISGRNSQTHTTKRAYDGRDVGLYREGDDLIPIVMRFEEEERRAVDGLPDLEVKSQLATESVPPAWGEPVACRVGV